MSANHATRSSSSDPQLPAYTDDLEWVTAYLVAHMMSDNSRVYTYLLWICIAIVVLVFTIAHLTGGRGGFIGAAWSKWALRRKTWRGKSILERTRRTGRKINPVILPPNSQIVSLIALPTIVFLLSFVGPDYLAPNLPLFDLDPSSLSARAINYDPSWFYQFQPQRTINKAWWTSGGRTGLIAFASMPLCVLFALKAPPFALFALPFTTQLYFDKLAWLHRWSGRLIWLITLLHVVLWSVQLLVDRRSTTGNIGYTYAWQYEKFIYGWIAFGLLTLLIFSSSRFIRKAHYEIFYVSHIILVPLTLIMSAMHHPPVAIWCYIALGLWCAERMWRATWWLQMNGFFGKEKSGSIVLQPTPYDSETQALQPWRHSTGSSIYPPASPYLDSGFSSYADGNLLAPATAIVYSPPPGFAHAELLSGATVRLTYITPGFLSWAPGQHFLINIPSVSRFLTHPFTTASICDEQAASVAGRAIVFLVRCRTGWTKDLWNHVANMINDRKHHNPGEKLPNGTVMPSTGVLLKMYVDGPFGSAVRARWGEHSTVVIFVAGSGVSFGLSILEFVCLCLAGRDGKYLGGRPGGWASKGFRTRRVKFVWMIREYAHIQWCASILRRCMAMIPSPGLDVDIFVTNFKPPVTRNVPAPQTESLQAPNPSYARSNPPSSEGSALYDSDGDDAFVDLSYYTGEFGDEENDISSIPLSERENYTLNLTEFEGDNDESLPGERQLNRKVQKQGKKLRAKSRKLSRILNIKQDVDQIVALEEASDSAHRRMSRRSDRSSPDPAMLAYLDSQGSEDGSIDLGMRPVSFYSPTEYPPRLISPSSSRSASPLPFAVSEIAPISTATIENQPSVATRSPVQPMSSPPKSDPSTPRSISRPSSPPIQSTHAPIKPSPLAGLAALDTSTLHLPNQPKRYSQPYSAISTAISDLHTDDGTEMYHSPTSNRARPRLIVEGQEMRDVAAVSVKARPGKPRLDRILHEEVETARGSVIVACCGPLSFNAMVRKAIASEINPSRIRRGDRRGHIELVSEEFEF
ncbi:hypothetical protein GYMLUDRAFT_1010241 [Collybiopsis luxurians FD-317 M1]|uniref:FAD-binding FR-type domain-containing protein n=1 Tax=Collybiopsis luxurians FD-317 M1 TaxID=944289 RepID=A0A0D0CHN9_9AGAR|nr:hypothetical protein GYMLUDRAFT_1010241 [Collybiopsis luxurians FD-317 M1]